MDIRLPVTFVELSIKIVEMPVPENIGVAVGISLITCLQAELFSLQLDNQLTFIYFRFTDGILESQLAQNLLQVFRFVAQTCLGKVTEALFFIPSSYELAIKILVLGYICTPISTMRFNQKHAIFKVYFCKSGMP